MSWSRRKLLGLSGALGITTAFGALSLQPGRSHTPNAPLQALSTTGFSVMVAAADALLPPADGFPRPSEVGVAEGIDQFLATCDPDVASELGTALLLVENAAASLVLDARLGRPFTACEPDVQRSILFSFRDSRFSIRRKIYKGLHGLITATYYGHPDVGLALGYRPGDYTGLLP